MVKRERPDETPTQARFRALLAIEVHDLDECLMQQPELFEHVARAYVEATAERDALKLDLDEAEAAADAVIRADADDKKERITEAAIKQRLTLHPTVKDLNRALLQAKADADSWLALKESFQQRSYMLKELVALHLSRLAGASVGSAYGELADANRARFDPRRRGG